MKASLKGLFIETSKGWINLVSPAGINEIKFLSFFIIAKDSSVICEGALSIIEYPNPSLKNSDDSRYLCQIFLYHRYIIFSADHAFILHAI